MQRKAGHAPFTHNLVYLVKTTDLEISDTHRKILTDINEFNIECRYPDEKFSIYKKATRKFTGDYLKKAEKMLEWILTTLNNE
ncbi:MAG: HEPN domain-containing protein [Spirochaetes bacterium]|nr:HEPN domain-containing protein [Spirochaetota bacterium]